MRAADRRAQRIGLLACRGARKGRAPDVGQHAHELIGERPELLRLLRLRVAPRPHQITRGQLRIAPDDFAVDGQRFARLRQYLADRLVRFRAEPLGRRRPKRGQRSGLPCGQHAAHLALEPQDVLAQPFALQTARCELGQQAADHRGQRVHVLRAVARVGQHQREVVTQARKITIAGEQCRAQRAHIDRGQAVAGALAGHVKDHLVLEFCGHVHGGSL